MRMKSRLDDDTTSVTVSGVADQGASSDSGNSGNISLLGIGLSVAVTCWNEILALRVNAIILSYFSQSGV
jgi:hypothetical protein